MQENARARAERLSEENAALAAQIGELRARFTDLRGVLAHLAEHERAIRSLAGLDAAEPAGAAPDGRAFAPRVRAQAHGDLDGLVDRAQRLAASWQASVERVDPSSAHLAGTPSILPTRGYLSRPFSENVEHPLLERASPHEGIDITARVGTPVVAAGGGRVESVTQHRSFGLVVELEHGNGYRTRYAHLSRAEVRPGERVERGATVGAVGSSGLTAGPHLHYEVRRGDRPQDPLLYVLDDPTLTPAPLVRDPADVRTVSRPVDAPAMGTPRPTSSRPAGAAAARGAATLPEGEG